MRLLPVAFCLAFTASALAGGGGHHPIARTEVLSDDYTPFIVELWSHGAIQLSKKSDDYYNPEGRREPIAVEQLDGGKFVQLKSSVLNLRGVALEIVYFPRVCEILPPPAISDLFVMSFDNLSGHESRMVLSHSGCWRGLAVHPVNKIERDEAIALQTKLIHYAFNLLDNMESN